MMSRPPRFPDVDWYCDHCGSYLNAQEGFDDHKYIWKCTQCKGKNSISRDNIRQSNYHVVNGLLDAVCLLRTFCLHYFLAFAIMRLSPIDFFQNTAHLKIAAISFVALMLVYVLIIVAAHFRNVGYLAMVFGTIFSDIIRPYRELLRCGRVFRDIRMHVSKRRVIAAIAKTGLYLLIVVAEICAVCSIAWMLFGSFGNGMALLKEWLGNIDNLSKLYVPFILFAAGMNVVSFLAFWLDKRYAVRQKWRIKESTLFVISILFGAVGAVLGMRVFRHKTKKLGFVVLLPILALLQIVIVIWCSIQYFL